MCWHSDNMVDEGLLNRIGELVRKEDALTECVKAMAWYQKRASETALADGKAVETLGIEAHDRFETVLKKIEKDFDTPTKCPKCGEIVGDEQEHQGKAFSPKGHDGYSCL